MSAMSSMEVNDKSTLSSNAATATLDEGGTNLLGNLPRELWHSRILPQLSLLDICTLDSATLNHNLRPALLHAEADVEVESETILIIEMMEWLMDRRLKPLHVMLTEEMSSDDVLRLVEYCPQIVSINTWDFEDDAQEVQSKSRKHDDNDAEYDMRRWDDNAIATILLTSTHLKYLRVCEMSPSDWFDCFPRIAHLCTHLDEIIYREHPSAGDAEDEQYTEFYFYSDSFGIHRATEIPLPLLTAVATHFASLNQLALSGFIIADEGLLELAKCCTGLKQAILMVPISGATLIEFCRLRPDLIELQIQYNEEVELYDDDVEPPYTAEDVRHAMELLPDLQAFCCFTDQRGGVVEAIIRAAVDTQPALHILGVNSTTCLSTATWDYVLQQCTALRTIRSAVGEGTGRLRAQARRHGVVIEQADSWQFCF